MPPGFDRLTDQLVAALHGRLAGKPLPRVPEAGMPLWGAFCALSARRTWHAHGPNPIAYAEIAAWAQIMRWPLAPHHVEVIVALDEAWLEHARAELGGGRKAKAPPSGGPPITAAILDAVFG